MKSRHLIRRILAASLRHLGYVISGNHVFRCDDLPRNSVRQMASLGQ